MCWLDIRRNNFLKFQAGPSWKDPGWWACFWDHLGWYARVVCWTKFKNNQFGKGHIPTDIIYSAICKQQCQIKNRNKWLPSFCFLVSKKWYCNRRNPASTDMVDIPLFTVVLTSHQQEHIQMPSKIQVIDFPFFFLGGGEKVGDFPKASCVQRGPAIPFFRLGFRKMWSSWQTCKNRRFPMVKQWELENSVVSSQGRRRNSMRFCMDQMAW